MFSLFFCVSSDSLQTVSEDSIKAFLEFFPQHMALAEKYGEDLKRGSSQEAIKRYSQEIEKLMDQAGISEEDFSVLLQKISIGFAIIQMEKSSTDVSLNSLLRQMGGDLTPEEIAVIRKYFSQIEGVFYR